LTEETPSPFMTDELRLKWVTAVKAAEYIKYEGAGTVEFWLISTVISILWK
jgi:acetyl-CoA carboxylase biotin carboxylase subunit